MKIVAGERIATVTDTAILGFFGPYRFLSNFHLAPVTVDGIQYPASEHAYMAQKTLDLDLRQKIADARSPSAAKALGRSLVLRPDWDNYRLVAMLAVLLEKFKDPVLAQRLLDTGDKYLEETNNWGDRFWGVMDGVGSNFLGQLLMIVRAQLRLSVPKPVVQPALFA